jgi:hypothetical protein
MIDDGLGLELKGLVLGVRCQLTEQLVAPLSEILPQDVLGF